MQEIQKQSSNETNWSLSEADFLNKIQTTKNGLSKDEAQKRLLQNGPNKLEDKDKKGPLRIFISQFNSPLTLLLMGGALVSLFIGERIDAYVILAIIVLSSFLGFFQEYKSSKALDALKGLVSIKTRVVRGGEKIEVDVQSLVVGDVIVMDIGDIIPADVRIISADGLTIDESSLTGESLPVNKNTTPAKPESTEPQDLENVAFMGTAISSGYGIGVVVATAHDTFFGKTASLLVTEPETDFQKSIRHFGNLLLKITFVMTLFILIANAVLGKSFFDSLLFAIALAVGITPEVLPILMTISLSRGALKMAKSQVITKTLASVENLGNIDILCCDKTGTLTSGVVELSDYLSLSNTQDEEVLLFGALCNNEGNPIDKAILEHETTKKNETIISQYKILDTNEFDFNRRRMSVIAERDNKRILIVKGAAENIISCCSTVFMNGAEQKITQKTKDEIAEFMTKHESNGYRVIAVATKPFALKDSSEKNETELTLRGVLLFLDPAKATAKEAIERLEKLGIAIKIISGDSALVTQKICHDVGLIIKNNRVITGEDLSKCSLAELSDYALKYNVFARVNPEQKYQIVDALTKQDHVVGFLGDGINDAPALKVADVGISVDSASDIAKQAADIILLQKSLRILGDGIVQGRKIFANIMKYILNTISANFGNMFTVAASSLFLPFIPLLPGQILLNNFVSDMPLLTIASDNVDDQMVHKPKRWDMKFITKFMIIFGLLSTFFDLLLILPLFFILKVSPEAFRTAWFIESSLSEVLITFAIRSTLPFFKSRPSNWLIFSSLATGAVCFALPYFTFGNTLFEFVPLSPMIIALTVGVLFAYFIFAEITKHIFFKKNLF